MEVPPTTVPTHWERGDPIADALHFLRMSGVVYCCSELTAPWGFHMPAMDDCLMFHVVTSGSCHLVEPGGTTHRLQAGDCLRFQLYGATRFACPPESGAHYLIAICEP